MGLGLATYHDQERARTARARAQPVQTFCYLYGTLSTLLTHSSCGVLRCRSTACTFLDTINSRFECFSTYTIGRMYSAHPSEGERYATLIKLLRAVLAVAGFGGESPDKDSQPRLGRGLRLCMVQPCPCSCKQPYCHQRHCVANAAFKKSDLPASWST